MTKMDELLRTWVTAGAIAEIDYHLARMVGRYDETPGRESAMLGACVLSAMAARGHVCVQLADVAGAWFPFETDAVERVTLPDDKEWLLALRDSSAVVSVAHTQQAPRPMLVDDAGRLYWYRLWDRECQVAQRLSEMASATPLFDADAAKTHLETLFPIANDQRLAGAVALRSQIAVVTGGPGTGKTWTVARVLVALMRGRPMESDALARFALAAPTGKAATRLGLSLAASLEVLTLSPEERAAIPTTVYTLHRLLASSNGAFGGGRDDGGSQRYLDADVVVVDEASMMDLEMMHALLFAMHPKATLILVGDPHQLASVEAGQVLADLCAEPGPRSAQADAELGALSGWSVESSPDDDRSRLADNIAPLTQNYRFSEDSGIGAIASAIEAGNVNKAMSVLSSARDDLEWFSQSQDADALGLSIFEGYNDYVSAIQRDGSPAQLLSAFSGYCVLCAHRHGVSGVNDINRYLDAEMRRRLSVGPAQTWYVGRAIMIGRNDYEQGLFNGDVGIYWSASAAPGRVYFTDAEGQVRGVAPERLPAHELAFAMTVHKAQGSEFDSISFLLPDAASLVLSRELVYTALTRAKKVARVFGMESVLRDALKRPFQRYSGLGERLRESTGVPD